MTCTQAKLGGAACFFSAAPLFLRVVRSCLTLSLALTFPPVPEICGTGVTLFLASVLSEITVNHWMGFTFQPTLPG